MANGGEALLGDRLAVRLRPEGNRLAEADRHVDGAEAGEADEMRDQVHVAIPGDLGPVRAADRKPVHAHVAYGDRLDMGEAAGDRAGRADERALEGQHAVSVAGGPLGEEHHDVAGADAPADGFGRSTRLAPPRPVDVERALQAGERAHDRPAADFRLGDEGHRQHAADDRHVEPGDVVHGNQERRLGRLPAHLHPDAEQRAGDPLPVIGNARGDRPVPPRREQLERRQHEGEEGKAQHRCPDAQPLHQCSPLSSSASGTP